MDFKAEEANRRELAVRHSRVVQKVAAWLNRKNITPNQISVMSVVFGLLGFSAMLANHYWEGDVLLLVTALCIQCRLLCNLFDGMVAIEGGKKTPAGELFNDVPDRITDPLFLIAAGFATYLEWGMYLAWACALVAVLTAYVRVLGNSMGCKPDFGGPMAKQHRMALLTAGFSILFLQNLTDSFLDAPVNAIDVTLIIILLGSIITFWRRLLTIYKTKENEGSEGENHD
ncbi:CDP-alcohol phosphatidyltransferase family protein [Grimontia marina]|uniref:CDP-alcohol phosphatidyltransferase n=1 Tax=Grimontia marina TaxID=646534 RepID=A0A128EUV5_9GAMM|nr:CDP-alcohol phosphatidyltransferase family protein [Grimontia marina]CZF77905.1 CDP-alcohol phosphatidyltransferase [Grimontia marina]